MQPSPPHFPDKGRSAERAHAAELAREAREHRERVERDLKRNAERVTEQLENGTAGVGRPAPSCKRCGDPYAALNDGLCPACIRDRKLTRDTDDKMSPEELHPDHFPEENEREEQQ